jgi:hypothetical protein
MCGAVLVVLREVMRLDIYLHSGDTASRTPAWMAGLQAQIGELKALIGQILQKQVIQMALLDDLEAKVEQVRSVEDSAVLLLQQLSQALKDAGTDPARLQAIIQKLDNDQTTLAAAIVQNTPAAATP